MKKCLLDTNIILDVLMNRNSFFVNSKKIVYLMEFSKYFDGYISISIITDVYYIAKKQNYSNKKIKLFLLELIEFINFTSYNDKDIVKKALLSDFSDFEDAVQNYSAEASYCDIIITRNKKDYKESDLQILTPSEFLKLV